MRWSAFVLLLVFILVLTSVSAALIRNGHIELNCIKAPESVEAVLTQSKREVKESASPRTFITTETFLLDAAQAFGHSGWFRGLGSEAEIVSGIMILAQFCIVILALWKICECAQVN